MDWKYLEVCLAVTLWFHSAVSLRQVLQTRLPGFHSANTHNNIRLDQEAGCWLELFTPRHLQTVEAEQDHQSALLGVQRREGRKMKECMHVY